MGARWAVAVALGLVLSAPALAEAPARKAVPAKAAAKRAAPKSLPAKATDADPASEA